MFFVTGTDSLNGFLLGITVAGGGVKPQKKAVADGRNRKPLGEIGNQQAIRGIEVKPNRPITRFVIKSLYLNSFCYYWFMFFYDCYFLTNVL